MPLVLLLSGVMASDFNFERIDIIAEDPGTWINYEVGSLPGYPTKGLVRWLTQIKPVVQTPVANLYIGLSLRSQSITYEVPIHEKLPLTASISLQTQLLLPKGANAGFAWKRGHWRLATGISTVSEASWKRPAYASWVVLPTIGFGFGPLRD